MDAAAKQQVVERVKQAQNILVTVSTNPTVDQLAACIGLTLLLNKMDKHATAVFSGVVPSTLEFLQPDKTIEQNTDSLRDFIISLDKEKADKLRYKVEDQVVKIFITPYRTSLSEKDLVFSQGDFNVEAVIALGVKDKGQLDAAITAHGRILHDATVISVNCGQGKAPDIGQINWQEASASSLSEMLVSISEAFGPNLIDNQIATAFLSGIVAETERFSNPKTSPKVMTMSAQLMAAGANQQLIVSKLEPPAPEPEPPKPAAVSQPAPQKAEAAKKEDAPAPPKPDDGTLKVEHALPKPIATPEKPREDVGEPPISLKIDAEPSANEETVDKEPEVEEIDIDSEGNLRQPGDEKFAPADKPPASMPGSHSLLTPSSGALPEVPFTANSKPEWTMPGQTTSLDPLSPTSGGNGIIGHAKDVQPPQMPQPNLDLNQLNSPLESAQAPAPHIDQARSAVENAFASAPFNPDLSPVEALNAVPMADLHPPDPAPQAPVAEAPTAVLTPDSTVLPLPPNDAAKTPPDNDKPAAPAPPPVPPPLMPSPGIVIPAAPYVPNKGIDSKIDSETL